MSFFKNLFGKKSEPEAPSPKKGIYGLHLGCAVELSSLDFRVLADQLNLSFPGETQLIEAVSRTALGAGSYMLRFYSSDDAFLQINYSGAENEHNVEDVMLFVYDKSDGISSDAAWERAISPAELGRPRIEYRGQTYQRVFFADEAGDTAPVAMTEEVDNSAHEHYRVDNFCMLYERAIGDEMVELLLINAEESADNERLVSYALGVHLSPSQFKVIS